MNRDFPFVLQQADWPAFIVNQAGIVCRSNRKAIDLFGAALTSGTAQLSTIWCPDNSQSPEQFLTQWQHSPSATLSLRFRDHTGKTCVHLVCLCAFADDLQEKYF